MIIFGVIVVFWGVVGGFDWVGDSFNCIISDLYLNDLVTQIDLLNEQKEQLANIIQEKEALVINVDLLNGQKEALVTNVDLLNRQLDQLQLVLEKKDEYVQYIEQELYNCETKYEKLAELTEATNKNALLSNAVCEELVSRLKEYENINSNSSN